MRALVIRGGRISLLLVRERSFLVHEGFKDMVAAIRAKAISGLLASQNR